MNGRIEGTWRHDVRGSGIDVTLSPFGKPAAWVRRGAEAEAERLAAFLGGTLRLSWSDRDVHGAT